MFTFSYYFFCIAWHPYKSDDCCFYVWCVNVHFHKKKKIKCFKKSHEDCKVRPRIVNINSDEP